MIYCFQLLRKVEDTELLEVMTMKSSKLLLGKKVMITGATGGLGRSIAEVFAENGAELIMCIRTNSIDFNEFCNQLKSKFNSSVRIEYLDLADQDSVDALVRKLALEDLDVDVLINNAGIPFGATTLMTRSSDLLRVFQINFFSQISLTQGIVRLMMRRRKGSIVNVSSVSGLRSDQGTLAYGGSKAALIHSTKVMATEFAPYGVRVNAVAPELIETQMLTNMSATAQENSIEKSNFDTPSQPFDIAQVVLFLASEMSVRISGEVISNSGGK
jgi:3-oxoacyl-[acyl-carrier protein] reductase